MLKKTSLVHRCRVTQTSESQLPRVPPQSGKWRHWIRQFRKIFLVSEKNPLTHLYFRSHASVLFERKRHIKFKSAYIIHPLSIFCVYREVVMMVIWQMLFIFQPISWVASEVFVQWMIASSVGSGVCFIDMILSFFLGYIDNKTREIVLDRRKIVTHYLKTYFLVDFFSSISSWFYFQICAECEVLVVLKSSLRFIRLGTMLSYMEKITDFFQYREGTYAIIRLCVLTINFMHWWACWMYFIPDFVKIIGVKGKTWRDHAKIDGNTPLYTKYLESLLQAMCLFCRAGIGMYRNVTLIEEVFNTIIIIFGGIFCAYMLVVVSMIVNLIKPDMRRYDEVIAGLKKYMINKRLPDELRGRLLTYYEYSFDKRYFNEKAILATLSEHLRYEIMLFNCMKLVQWVRVFDEFPGTVRASLVSGMVEEVYLRNDVIYRVGEVASNLYIIQHGTAASYCGAGKELAHLRDGDILGDLAIILRIRYFASLVAIESTTVYRLSAAHLDKCLASHPQLYQKMIDRATLRWKNMKELFEQNKEERSVRQMFSVIHLT